MKKIIHSISLIGIVLFSSNKLFAAIGGEETNDFVFTKHIIDITNPTIIYMYSDGFQDQFGGQENKKYMVKRFRNFLFNISHLPLNEQYEKVAQEFLAWKGKREQTDDVLVMGVKA